MKDIANLASILTNIDNIVFDLGGVIINIDYMRTQRAFESLGLANFSEVYSQAAQTGVFDLYEKGLMDTATFRDKLRQFVPDFKISNEELDNAWNAMLLDLPADRLEVLMGVKDRFRTFLLSNTNEIHIDCFHAKLEASYGKKDFAAYFERVYYSYQMHLRKPDKEIFYHVLNENTLQAENTLFIDDTIRHVEAARSVGIKALHIGSDIELPVLYKTLATYRKI